MKCMLCPNEIDEMKSFPVAYGPGGVVDYDEKGQRAHAAELTKWRQILVVVGVWELEEHALQGHICPDETPAELAKVALTKIAGGTSVG